MRRIDRDDVLRRFSTFGLQRFAHHSGLGGYSKLLLADLLPVLREEAGATIVYVSTTREAEELSAGLRGAGLRAAVFQGSLDAAAKLATLRRFVNDELQVRARARARARST